MRLIAEWKPQPNTHKCQHLLVLGNEVFKCICCGQYWLRNEKNNTIYPVSLVYIQPKRNNNE